MRAVELLSAICVAGAALFLVVGDKRRSAVALTAAIALGVLNALIVDSASIGSAFTGEALRTPLWALALFGPVVALFLWFASIKILQEIISGIYGRNVAARLTASALAQTFRTIGQILRFLVTLPLRLFRRRDRLDDMLNQWRRG